MPHKIPEEITATSGTKPWLEPHTKQEMSEELNDEQKYSRAKERFPRLSFECYNKNSCLFDDENIQASLPSREAVRKYLDSDNLLLYASYNEGSQEAPLRQSLHELIEKGSADEEAKYTVDRYLDCHLASISSDAARQVFSSSNLYEDAIRPLLARYPEIVREATVQLAAVLIKKISNQLKDKDGALRLSTIYAIRCSQLRCLINDPELGQFLPADQLEVATKTLEEAAKLYNDDPDLYDYLEAAYDALDTLDYH
jgi:hypothetical protein